MPRPDLLALTLDDLATLANRGLVKRAQTELSSDQLEYTLSENKAGTVSVLWSDDVHCLLPSNTPLQEARCSCPATTLCRHLIRSVLAYQQEHADETTQPDTAQPETTEGLASNPETVTPKAAPPTSNQPSWNPAEISDELLAQIVPPTVLIRARREWDAGHVVEVTPSAKPSVFFHSAGVNLRFLVPHDARYTHCDCAEAAPCVHVPLGVWAFRQANSTSSTSLVSTRQAPLEVPTRLISELETAMTDLAWDGVSNTSLPFIDRLKQLERECRSQGLIWPADIVAELKEQIEFYQAHNARFEPVRVAHLVGELLIRCDAINSETGEVPPLFVRGTAKEKSIEVGAARLIGLGTSARLYKGGAELQAFMQDMDSGVVVVVKRDFPNPQADATTQLLRGGGASNTTAPEPQQLWKLATAPVAKGVGLGALGSGQLLVRGGKRTPSGEFVLGRSPASFNFQTFEWDKLRAPLFIENFAALETRFQVLPPTSLRPRRLGEDIHVVPLVRVESAFFDRAEHTLKAVLCDREGGTAHLVHPFTSRGTEGFESLLQSLTSYPDQFRFVAARFERHSGTLVASPLALVIGDGKERRAIQPWVDQQPVSNNTHIASVSTADFAPISASEHILRDFTHETLELIGETLLIGLRRSDSILARQWETQVQRCNALGLSQLGNLLEEMTAQLTQKNRGRQWDGIPANTILLKLIVYTRLLGEML